MITNTCLTGGSFVLEPPGEEPEEPDDPPSPAVELGELLPLETGGAFAAVVVEASGAAGVGAGSDSGGSPPADGDGEAAAGAAAVEGGRTSFRRRPEAACVLLTGEP